MAMLRSFLLLFIIFSMGNAADLSERCPCGWKNFGLRCYKFFPQLVNWVAAQKNCQSLGANLASVHSKAENDFLLRLLPSSSTRAWAGAHDGELERQWLWTDGTAYDYTNWCMNEPNNLGTENCLEICWASNRCWNDIACSTAMGYICATDL